MDENRLIARHHVDRLKKPQSRLDRVVAPSASAEYVAFTTNGSSLSNQNFLRMHRGLTAALVVWQSDE
jgi:hypothetical protein